MFSVVAVNVGVNITALSFGKFYCEVMVLYISHNVAIMQFCECKSATIITFMSL